MFHFKGIGFRVMVAIMTLVCLAAGTWLTFFHDKGFVESEGTIVKIEEIPGTGTDDKQYIVTVGYDVDGKHYEGELGSYSPGYKVGKTVKIVYDPADPARMHSKSLGFGIYVLGIGVLGLLYSILTPLLTKKKVASLGDQVLAHDYAPAEEGEERKLYFLTDRGTAKYGHRIEDGDRKVLYEGKVTKFTLNLPTGFDFIDHVEGTTTPHLVGHEEARENNFLLLDNYYTFTFDGVDIWKHLKDHGISMETSFSAERPLFPIYHIFRDNVEIACAETTSMYPHEEDAEGKPMRNAVPARGYYRIYTSQKHLDLLFVALLALARTESLDAQGGSISGLLSGRKPTK